MTKAAPNLAISDNDLPPAGVLAQAFRQTLDEHGEAQANAARSAFSALLTRCNANLDNALGDHFCRHAGAATFGLKGSTAADGLFIEIGEIADGAGAARPVSLLYRQGGETVLEVASARTAWEAQRDELTYKKGGPDDVVVLLKALNAALVDRNVFAALDAPALDRR